MLQTLSSRQQAWLIYVLLAFVWGSSFILIMRGLDVFSAWEVGAIRLVIAGLVMLPLVIHRIKEVPREKWKYIISIGILGNALPAVLFPLAELHINSASAGVLNSLSSVFTLVLGMLFFGLQFTRFRVLGVFIGLIGAAALILGGSEKLDAHEHIPYALLAVVATIGYGLSTNIIKKYLQDVPTLLASGFALMFVAIPYLVYLPFTDIISDITTQPKGWMSLLYVGILGAVGTSLALIFYYRLVQLTDPVFSSSLAYVIPLIAVSWGLLDNETFSAIQLIGMATIFVGVWLTNRKT